MESSGELFKKNLDKAFFSHKLKPINVRRPYEIQTRIQRRKT